MAESYPLAGIRVIDLGQIYNGPYATFLMAMAGADVIKVEPKHGEPLRRRSVADAGSLPLALLNANKRGVTLNLKHPRGRALLIALAETADVLLENFAPGVMAKLGLGHEALQTVNPRLIYASGSGYGRSGPNKDDLAMDLTVQATSGLMSVTGMPDGPPVKAGGAVCDFLGGTHLYAAVVTALYERERTGRGRLVEVAMQEATLPTLVSNLGMMHLNGGAVPPRTGSRHGGMAIAPYNVYRCRDGYVAIITATDRHWLNVLDAMGRPDLKNDPRFANNEKRAAHMEIVDKLVEGWTLTLDRDDLLAAARRHHIACAPVRDLTEVAADPHMHERGMLTPFDHPDLGPITAMTSPLRFDGLPPAALTPSPRLGADNADVYGGLLGLSADEIAALENDGVI